MDKRIALGIMAVLVVAAILSVVSISDAASPILCNGLCANKNCAAAQGGACDCKLCSPLCETGSCSGTCGEQTCGAKTGKTCGCEN